jgi:serine O-acetyltransferase
MSSLSIKKILQADLYRYQKSRGAFSLVRCLFLFPGFRFTFVLRQAAVCRKYSIRGIFWRFWHRRLMYKFGFEIPVHTRIGKGFYIGHFGGIVVNGRVSIGDYCNITHGVTLGQANRGKNKGFPVLGDRVWLGAHAVVVGNVKIGSNVMIAPNTFVNFDVPDNAIVIGNPGKIIIKIDATEGYINHLLEE